MNKKNIIILIIILSIFLVGGIVTGVVVSSKSSSKSSSSGSGSNQTKSCPNNCSGNGTCDSNGVCTCYSGYSGSDCKVECPSLCSNRGICKDGKCTCKDGYYGSGCEFINCPVGPNKQTCSGFGRCNSTSGKCICTNNSPNNDCSINCPIGSNGQICSGKGLCNTTNKVCQCLIGYSGTDCSFYCPPGQVSGNTPETIMNCYRKPTDTEIGDMGYLDSGRWLDVEGTGYCFNYCRMVGPAPPVDGSSTAPVVQYSCTSQVKNGQFDTKDIYNPDYTGYAAADPTTLKGKLWAFGNSGDPAPKPCTL